MNTRQLLDFLLILYFLSFQVYHVAYIIIKAANSPRPGNWILERSINGETYTPWQYYAMSDSECETVYGIEASVGVPRIELDDQVLCSSHFSRLDPLQGGEVSTGGRFKKAYDLLNLRALKISTLYTNRIFQWMGKIFCVEFQRYPLKFHTKYLIHTWKDVYFIHRWKFKSSWI